MIAAALVGALSPFCSCGVIPLVAALLAAGVPLAPVMAFWIASPIMDPEMFILTAAGIGTGFAVAKTLAAVSMGLFAGYATLALDRAGALRSPLKQAPRCGCKPSIDTGATPAVVWTFWTDPARRTRFRSEVETTGWFLFKWLTFAFLLESLMTAYVPSEWIAGLVGAGSAFALPLAVLVGMPSYLNGYAAIPLVSGLLDLGMSQGAALAFMTRARCPRSRRRSRSTPWSSTGSSRSTSPWASPARCSPGWCSTCRGSCCDVRPLGDDVFREKGSVRNELR